MEGFRAVRPIAEGDVLESEIAANGRQRRPLRIVGRLGGGVQDVAQALDGEPCLVEILPQLGQPQHRLADPPREDVEGDQLADREAAVNHQLGTEVQDRRHH